MLKPYYETDCGKLYHGSAPKVLKSLPDGSVHCCVTSPPYYGLRAYGTSPQVFGGAQGCKHEWADSSWKYTRKNDETAGPKQRTNAGSIGDRIERKSDTCQICGAWRGELGLEPHPDAYIAHMVEIFRYVRRVLRSDGVCFVNIGDTYGAGGGQQVVQTKNASHGLDGMRQKTPGFQSKQLILIPARLSLALQSDGWIVRQDIVWQKPNPLPESVKDRCTRAHEYIFHLSKSQRYWFDNEAIKEDLACPDAADGTRIFGGKNKHGANIKHGNRTTGRAYSFARKTATEGKPGLPNQHRVDRENIEYIGKRNKRSVWTVSTKPFSGAHFAVFPPELIEPCILAGCPVGGTVLDPFMGSGTTAIVAHRYDRKFIGIELNRKYLDEIAIPRINAATSQLKLFG